MRCTQHISNNTVLKSPPGTPNDVICNIPATLAQFGDGTRAIATFWEFSSEDIEKIKVGCKLRLFVLGDKFAPVSLVVTDDIEGP